MDGTGHLKPSEVPLLNRVIIVVLITHFPNWTYQDATVDNSNGYTVTLTFYKHIPGS